MQCPISSCACFVTWGFPWGHGKSFWKQSGGFRGTNSFILRGNDDRLRGGRMPLSLRYFNRLQLLLSISRKKKAASYSPYPGSCSHLAPVAVTAGRRGDRDARPRWLVIPSLAASATREWFVFLRMCRLQRVRAGGLVMREAFPHEHSDPVTR